MNVLRFLQIYRIHVIFIICVFFSLSLYFSNESKPVRAVQADISDIISFVLSPKKWYKNILNVKEKNEYLIETVSQLRLLNSELIHLKYENDELRKMLQFKNISPLSLVGTGVVSSQLSSHIQTLILNTRFKKYKNKILRENFKKKIYLRPAWKLISNLKPYHRKQKMNLTGAKEIYEKVINLPSSQYL